MKRQKFLFALFLFSLAALSLRAELRVASIQAKSGFPWNGKVVITVQLEGTPVEQGIVLSLVAHDNATGEDLPLRTFSEKPAEYHSAGTYTLVWDAAADYPGYYSDNMQIQATLEEYTLENCAAYLVIDLSGGADAERYPFRESNVGPDLSGDVCRTTELWLRRIPAGTFVMGSPEDEGFSNETQHQVTLTQDYYIGVFEVTQKQYELVTGSNPSA